MSSNLWRPVNCAIFDRFQARSGRFEAEIAQLTKYRSGHAESGAVPQRPSIGHELVVRTWLYAYDAISGRLIQSFGLGSRGGEKRWLQPTEAENSEALEDLYLTAMKHLNWFDPVGRSIPRKPGSG